MSFTSIVKTGWKAVTGFCKANRSTILKAITIGGTVAGTAMVISEAMDAGKEIDETERENTPVQIETKEEVKIIAKHVWPGVVVIAGACTLGILNTRMSDRAAAAYSAAYNVAADQLKEYSDKVIEKIGKKKEEEMRQEITADHYDQKAIAELNDIPVKVTGNGDQLFRLRWTGEYFLSDRNHVDAAFLAANKRMMSDDYVRFNYLREQLGLDWNGEGEYLGFPLEDCDNHTIDYDYTAAVLPAGCKYSSVTEINVVPHPIDDYHNWY